MPRRMNRAELGRPQSEPAPPRDELLNRESFYTLREAQIVIESWRRHYNTIRPHASLGYKPPAPEVFLRRVVGCAPPRGSAGHAGEGGHEYLRCRWLVSK